MNDNERIMKRLDRVEEQLNRYTDIVDRLDSESKEQKRVLSPFLHWLRGLEAASDLARIIRGIIGWIVFLLGAGSVTWIAINTPNKNG